MAYWKHRKLFPTNQTQDCYGFCDPACPYNCYSYPDYYYSPPPPVSSSDHASNHISSYLIILVSLFTVIFVVVGFYVAKVKCYADWCGWRFSGSGPARSNNNAEDNEFLNENQVDHPVWLIATIGLQQSIINSITICKYSKDEGLIEGTECSVCLNEFQEGETLRLLPKCNHAFHIPCIDTWLRSHTNCPLCRAGIVSISNNVNSEGVVSNQAPEEQDNADSRRNREAGVENSRNFDALLTSNMVASVAALRSNAGIGETSEAPELTNELNSNKGHGNFDRCHVAHVLEQDIPESGTLETCLVSEDHRVLNEEIQKETRSASPVSGLANSCSREPEIGYPVDCIRDDTESNTSTMRRSSVEECLRISPISMKRSFSCNGRILYGRGYTSQNSSLPN